MAGRVTMRDVARAVDVSPMTVSRALRGDETVSTKTRAQIEEAARRLGYVYDTTAQAFRTKKSGFVAVTLPSINNANFAETFRGLSDGLKESGLQLLLGSTNYSVANEEQLVRQLLTRNPEAIVLTGGHHTDVTCELLQASRVPVIETWDLPAKPLGHVVGFSNAAAMELVVAHLVERGHSKLAFIGAGQGEDLRGAARRDGAIAAAERLGLPEIEVIEAGPAPISMKQGADVVARLGTTISSFDAVICVADPVAFGVLSECRRLGLDVPGDLAITGFGKFDVSQVSYPQITTVAVHATEIGRAVAEILCALADPPDRAWQRIDVGSKLVIGGTS